MLAQVPAEPTDCGQLRPPVLDRGVQNTVAARRDAVNRTYTACYGSVVDHYTYLQYFVTPGGRLRRGTYRDRFTDFQLLIDQRGSMFTGEAYLSGLPSDPALPRNTGDFCHFHSPMLSDAWIDEMAERCLAALLEPPQDRR